MYLVPLPIQRYSWQRRHLPKLSQRVDRAGMRYTARDQRIARLLQAGRGLEKNNKPKYATYRLGKPYVPAKRHLNTDIIMAWLLLGLIIVCAGLAGSGGF